jgi:hypothetical protein
MIKLEWKIVKKICKNNMKKIINKKKKISMEMLKVVIKMKVKKDLKKRLVIRKL